MTAEDTYKTIIEPSEGIYTEKRSKFIAIALPVRTLDEIKIHLKRIRKSIMTHDTYVMPICWELHERISVPMTMENLPEQTGKPILGQINLNELTDILIIVVRYFWRNQVRDKRIDRGLQGCRC